jgi:hypothetical protein
MRVSKLMGITGAQNRVRYVLCVDCGMLCYQHKVDASKARSQHFTLKVVMVISHNDYEEVCTITSL